MAETGEAKEHSEGMGTIPNPIFPLALNVFVQMPQTSMLGHMAFIYCFSFSLKIIFFLIFLFYFLSVLFYLTLDNMCSLPKTRYKKDNKNYCGHVGIFPSRLFTMNVHVFEKQSHNIHNMQS